MIFKGREYFLRCNEVRRYIRKNRHSLRTLAEGRCPDDNRLLAAVFHFDGFWLWQIGERRTRQQVLREVLEHAVTELEVLIENGEDSAELRALLADPEGGSDKLQHDTLPEEVNQISDPLQTCHSLSMEQVLDRMPSGIYSSCSGCRRTYVVDSTAMGWATGQTIETHSRRPVTVLLSRVKLIGPDETVLDRPELGVVPRHQHGMRSPTASPDAL